MLQANVLCGTKSIKPQSVTEVRSWRAKNRILESGADFRCNNNKQVRKILCTCRQVYAFLVCSAKVESSLLFSAAAQAARQDIASRFAALKETTTIFSIAAAPGRRLFDFNVAV